MWWPFKKKKIDQESILKNFSYREGSTFTIGKVNDEKNYSVILISPMICADTGETSHIHSWRHIKQFSKTDEEQFKMEVLRLCFQQEMHEAMEFLKYSGDRLFDPHNGKYSAYSMSIEFNGKTK